MAYDALGRLRWVADTNAYITIDYDKVGNRTRDEHAGVRIVQDNGQWTAVAGNIVEEYSYDNLNRLSTVVRDGALVEARGYDGASRVIQSAPGALGADYVNLHRMLRGTNGTDALQGRFSQYDANGRLIHQATAEYLVSASVVDYTYDNEGNALSYLVADTVNGTFTATTNTVERAEGYRTAASLSVTTSVHTGGITAQGIMGYNYDANGHLKSTGDVGQTAQPDLRTHNFVNDANGNALYAYYAYEGTPDKRVNGQRQMVVNGEVLGRYGLLSDTRFDGTPLAQNGPFFTAQNDFSFGYQPINGNYPAGTPGSYSVGVSDTLQTIAKGAYGDSSLWYLIADANGLSGNADLRAGQVLRIPAATSSANNANTFKPYDPSKIASDSPTMMATPQSQGGGCGGLGQIIVAVVAIVVTYFTAGALSGPMSAAFGATGGAVTTAGTVAAGAIGGAVGSIASQAVGIAIGAQDGFSWKGVALGAIGGAVSAGLGGANVLPDTGNAFVNGAMRGALGSTITQGVAVVTGLQDKFSWKSVAASAVSAGVSQGLNSAMQYDPKTQFDFGKSFVSGFGGALVGTVVRGGKISGAQIAADAFGNIIGDALAKANNVPGVVGAEEKARILGYFADGPGTGFTFADDMAMRRASINPMGLPTTSVAGNTDGLYARNGMDVMDDTTDASGRRVVTVGQDQGPLAAFRSAGMSSAEAQAMYGQALATGQIRRNAMGMPIVQPGQTLYVDLNDVSQAGYGGNAIGLESRNRAAIAEEQMRQAVQQATYRNENYGNEGYRSMPSVSASYNDISWLSQRGRPMVEQPVYDMMNGLPTGMTQMVPAGNSTEMSYVEQMANLSSALHVREGGVKTSYDRAVAGITNGDGFVDRAINTVGATAMFPLMAGEELVRGALNIPSAAAGAIPLASQAGTSMAIALDPSQPFDVRFSGALAAVRDFSGAFVGLGGAATVAMPGLKLEGPPVPRGLSRREFDDFSTAMRDAMSREGLPPGETYVHGSRGYGKVDRVTDIDLIHIVSDNDFAALLNKRMAETSGRNQKILLKNAENQERITARSASFDLERIMWTDVHPKLPPSVTSIQFSIAKRTSPFNQGPFIPLN
ncbi:LysM peptidoglycan-binding domain-containing protein [Variovorax sp. CAN2819]|uniref:LysM peptidoglycan-binding domain-containing protein n=1 Tax=Variovorax sp. CAN15 TaxID=3046727 RepID=UPI00264A0868|nr:LysM peptidoglycan-binding domain-containing protein [Variovorax sp. CAN15]MDN6886173.1 LysM peptidoglycan-binding domain-containing protein [Variovorax sp. CAN15]